MQNKGPMRSVVPMQAARQAPLLHLSIIHTCNCTFFFFNCTRDCSISRSFCPLNWQMFTYLSLGIQMKDGGMREAGI